MGAGKRLSLRAGILLLTLAPALANSTGCTLLKRKPASAKIKASSISEMAATALATSTLYPRSAASTNNQLENPTFRVANVVDGDGATAYSSNGFPNSNNNNGTHLIVYMPSAQTVDQVVFQARTYNGIDNGFPKKYDLYLTNSANSGWDFQGNFSAQPDSSHRVIIQLPNAVTTWGVRIVPTVLGKDIYNNYYFQMAEVWLGLSAPVPMPPVKIAQVEGQGIFYINSVNQPVAMRGVNYIPLDGNSLPNFFDLNVYNSATVDSALQQMRASGYNYVRIFVDGQGVYNGFSTSSPGLPSYFINNVADFLDRARSHNLYVQLSGGWLPPNYYPLVKTVPMPANLDCGLVTYSDCQNGALLHPGFVAATAQYFKDLLSGVAAKTPIGVSSIFAVDIRNEMTVQTAERPFSMTSGSFNFGGTSFDLANPSARQQLIDSASVEWMNQIRTAIKGVIPTVLVGTSVYTPLAEGRPSFDGAQPIAGINPSYPLRLKVLSMYSQADYVDLHSYPGFRPDKTDLESAEFSDTSVWRTPVIMGEYGIFKSNYSDAATAGAALQSLMKTSCNYGFSGWGEWTWDSTVQTAIWNLTEQGGVLNNYVSPNSMPTVCAPIPAGIFRTASAVYYSNGTSYCHYSSWARYVELTGRGDLNGVPIYPRTSALMPFDGYCGGY